MNLCLWTEPAALKAAKQEAQAAAPNGARALASSLQGPFAAVRSQHQLQWPLTWQQTVLSISAEHAVLPGREAPGTAYRLYTEATHDRLDPERAPEVLRTSLATVVLQLKVRCMPCKQLAWRACAAHGI